MQRPRFIWQFYTPLVVIVCLSVFFVAALTARSLHDFYVESSEKDLEAQARLVARIVLESDTGATGLARLDEEIKELGRLTRSRITVVQPDGNVIADSAAEPGAMDNHAHRPEIARALLGTSGTSSRFSNTIQENLLYVAVPVRRGDEVVAVVRTAVPLTSIERALDAVNAQIVLAGLFVAAVAAAISLLVSRRLSRPLEQLEAAAGSFAEGKLDTRLPASGSNEVASLARAMNHMASQLDDRIRAVVRQRNEQAAVFSAMVEGVLAIDPNERLIAVNDAAARLLDIDPADAIGRTIVEVSRTPELHRFAAKVLLSEDVVESDLTMYHRQTQQLQAHGAPIYDATGNRIGSVIVLNDVTRLRRLETIRRDFVANVSHELKTPITSIKGFLETLANGALNDRESAHRFVEIASRQADRLIAIIDDLLSLSHIEEEAQIGEMPRTSEHMSQVVQGAIDVCRIKAEEKQVPIEVSCDPRLIAELNAPLIEQAIVNLIDNAVKYSEPGSPVRIEVDATAEGIRIKVRDSGPGIEAAHLPRLFERFYRVDKARSRKLGGTGLGLAIVKHIVTAHGGTVSVASEPGAGTVFTIVLPQPTHADLCGLTQA